jgi:hypothetical protein
MGWIGLDVGGSGGSRGRRRRRRCCGCIHGSLGYEFNRNPSNLKF